MVVKVIFPGIEVQLDIGTTNSSLVGIAFDWLQINPFISDSIKLMDKVAHEVEA